MEFVTFYPKSDIAVPTAVRLSASFSYVSPMARPLRDGKALPEAWLADGGYADNEGVLTALNAIVHLLGSEDPQTLLTFDRILVLRIFPFPQWRRSFSAGDAAIEDPQRAKEAERDAQSTGRTLIAIGPIYLLTKVREASQADRGTFELFQAMSNAKLHFRASTALADTPQNATREKAMHGPGAELADQSNPFDLIQKLEKRDRAGRNAPPPPEPVAAQGQAQRPIQISFVTFVFPEVDSAAAPPLSWKLSPKEKSDIDLAWQLLLGDPTAANAEIKSQDPFHSKVFLSDHATKPDLSLEWIFGREWLEELLPL
jgi:hypothetical protein